jgi:serine O-acetyltransferase
MRAEVGAVSLLGAVRADFQGYLDLDEEKTRSALRRTFDVLTLAGFMSSVLHRLAAAAYRRRLIPVARLVQLLNVVLFSCEISPRASIAPGFVLVHPDGVAIGAGVVIGPGVTVYKGVSVGTAGYRDKRRDGFPHIGAGCRLFDGAKVFGPVEVGEGSIIGTTVTLFESVPPGSVVTTRQELDIRFLSPTH